MRIDRGTSTQQKHAAESCYKQRTAKGEKGNRRGGVAHCQYQAKGKAFGQAPIIGLFAVPLEDEAKDYLISLALVPKPLSLGTSELLPSAG